MKKGFTLIELLVVVLIIGILSSVAVPKYLNGVEKAKYMKMISSVRALHEAQQRYIAANGVAAKKLSDLDVDFSGPRLSEFSSIGSCGSGAHFRAQSDDAVVDMGEYEVGIGGPYHSPAASVAYRKGKCRAVLFALNPYETFTEIDRPLCYGAGLDNALYHEGKDWCSKTFGFKAREHQQKYAANDQGALSGTRSQLPY